MNTTATEKMMDNIKSVLLKFFSKVKKDKNQEDALVVLFPFPEGTKHLSLFSVRVSEDSEYISLSLTLQEQIPENKVVQVLELISLINCFTVLEYLYFFREHNLVGQVTGVFAENGLLDKIEFEKIIKVMLTNGNRYFPIISEQITSEIDPRNLIAKHLEKFEQPIHHRDLH